jgi:cation-transporting ATPase I
VLSSAASPVRATVSLAGAVREELRDPLTPVLAVGATASAIVGSSVDAFLVGGVMMGNALISGLQRRATENTLRQLLLEQEVTARRVQRQGSGPLDGAALADLPIEKVPAKALQPGDIIALESSDVIPADARLLHVEDLEVDESALTGESAPVTKDVAPTPGVPVAERRCMVFDGTAVVAGTAYAVVVATGAATQAGRATRLAGRAAAPAGIQARLHEVTRTALPATGIGGGAVTGLAMLRGSALREAVAAGVSIAVAAVPEGLPLVATVAQAGAAQRLSRSNTLVRSPRTLEALGRVDVVCFDKTGTLTEGKLALARIASATGELEEGSPEAQHVLAAAARACPPLSEDELDQAPHATDRAILEAGKEAADSGGWQLTVELPFESTRGLAASLGTTDEGPVLAVKGAPEVLLPLCTRAMEGDSAGRGPTELTDERRHTAEETTHKLAADGLRVLAVAERREDIPEQHDDIGELAKDLTLLGFVGIADTPRQDAADGIRELAGEGVRIVMVTGDHPDTAAAIARAVGISDENVVTGAELDQLTESQRIERVRKATVFARVSPEHKLQIVDAFQRDGRVVAMTGDGINDAAAIRLADVGIGVAGRATTSARSAADLVIADADVRRVHEALLEGRALWRRVQDAVSILVGGNAGEIAFMVLGTALGGRAPINTRQLLLVNMFTDMFPALAVALAPSRNGETEQNLESARGALGPPLARAVAVRGAATALGATTAWTVGRLTGREQRASSMGLAALVTTQLGQTLLTGHHSPLVIATSLASLGVLVGVIETPVVSHFFGCTPLGPVAWGVVLASAAAGTATAAIAPRWLAPEA